MSIEGVAMRGLPELQKNIDALARRSLEQARRAISEIGDIAWGNSIRNAPIDEGVLQASIEKFFIPRTDGATVRICVPVNAPASSYAEAMHEGQYELGPLSLEKQKRTGGTVGRKFITRGVEDGIPDYDIIVEERMKL